MGQPRNHRRTVTSQDVAEYANVSRATVSAVVNKSRYVSEDLIEKVEDAIRALNYEPNIVARSLKTQRSNIIGLVIPNVLSPVWALITRSVEVRARELGFTTIVCDTDEDLDTERTCVQLLTSRQVDGIILAPCSTASEDYLRSLVNNRAFLFLDRQPHTLSVDYISPDKPAGAYEAVMHLVAQGARRIAIVTNKITGQDGEQSTLFDLEWLHGYRQALLDSGIPIDERFIRVGRRGGHSESDGYANAKEMLEMADRPDAIIACTHFTTMGVLRAARDIGVQIPHDLALVGYEDVLYNEYIRPSLTVVRQPWEEAGCLAVELLVRRIQTDSGTPPEPESHLLPVRLVIRESSIVHRAAHVAGTGSA